MPTEPMPTEPMATGSSGPAGPEGVAPVDEGAGGPPARRARIATVVALLLVPVAGAALIVAGQQARQHELEGRLAVLVTGLLEGATADEHRAHGHDFGHAPAAGTGGGTGGDTGGDARPGAGREVAHGAGHEVGEVVCAVDPFGVEPAGAGTVAEVEWVYAHHMCAITGPGAGWAMSVRASGPIAVRLGGRPVVRVPEPGAGYPERVRRLIPERHHDAAFGEFGDEDAIEAARRRFDVATGR